MEIDINQQKISIGDKYKAFINGSQTHSASKAIFKLLPEIKLCETGNTQPATTIKRKLSWYKAKYDITAANGSVYQFRTISWLKSHFQCPVGSDVYDIYGHRGRKYSIYKNGVQVAMWDKKAVAWFNGDNYKLTANNQTDTNLLITFCLVIDSYVNNDGKKKGVLNVSFGNLFFQAKQFDTNWQAI